MEAARISEALSSLPAQLVAELRRRAAEYLDQRLAIFSRYGYRQSRGELAPEPERLACAALRNGRCSIYEHRPTICRSFGAALMHQDGTDRVFACQFNFAQGERIDDDQLVSAQQARASQSLELNRAYGKAGGRCYRESITVAHALLEDFRSYLP